MALTKQTQNGFGWLYNPKFDPLWQKRHLYSLATWTNGMAFRELEFSEVGRPIIKIAEIKNGLSGQTKYTEREYDPNYLITAGDMLFCWSGQPETSIDVYWWRNVDGWLNQHIFKVEPGPDVDRLFFFYVLRYLRPYFIAIARNKQTTGLGHVTKVDLERIEVGLPSKPEQRAIAAILGALDDKIELNRRMNETLEAMARAIFKSWFVDFDPVRAKMDGRWRRGQSLPGLLADLYDLFPDRLVESELGEIPEGWESRPVVDFADLSGGKQLEKRIIFSEGEIPVFGGAGVMGYTENHNADGFVIAVGRVGAYCGQFFSHRGKAWINNNASLVRQRKECLGEWLFLSLRHADIDVIKKGAAQPFVSNGDIAKLPLIWPGEQVVQSFSGMIVPLLKKQEGNDADSKSLAQLRDTLLPKLISGELRVKDSGKLFTEKRLRHPV
jgi:type I restriction enzyme S subunit